MREEYLREAGRWATGGWLIDGVCRPSGCSVEVKTEEGEGEVKVE